MLTLPIPVSPSSPSPCYARPSVYSQFWEKGSQKSLAHSGRGI